jgi:TolB-like protein
MRFWRDASRITRLQRHARRLHPVAWNRKIADISAHPVLRQERRRAPEGAIVAQVSESESEDFAGRLSLALRASNLSRSQLSATLGVHKSLVSRWLSGQVTPTSYNLARISAVFAKLKPGFNMILWTAPRAQFEAALGLSPEKIEPFAFSRGAIEAPSAEGGAPALPHNKPSLAVLPFANLSRDPDQDYFVEGMMEEIITALSRIRSIFVIGSGSTRSFKGQSIDTREAARQLGVAYIVEGSVRRSSTKVRISVKLTDASQRAQIWGEKFEGTLDDVFALQDQVALSIAGAIEPTVHAVESRHAARRPVESLGCYDLHLQAAALRATLHKAEVLKAIDLLDRALALEPRFAPALGQAAGCHSLVVLNNWSDDPEWHRRQGLTMAERAIAAGSDDAAVLAQTANALMELDNDVGRARALIDRAIALNHGSAYAWFISGIISLFEDDADAAARHFQEAARLDPLSSLGEMARAHIAMARAVQGNYVEAARLYGETTYRTPRIHLTMAAVHGALGNLEDARKELRLYANSTTVPPEAMLKRMVCRQSHRDGLLEGLKRACAPINSQAPKTVS